jgi:hypothetical protein
LKCSVRPRRAVKFIIGKYKGHSAKEKDKRGVEVPQLVIIEGAFFWGVSKGFLAYMFG